MSKAFVLLAMIFCHIVDDYCLQTLGPLATMKQKKWWEENHPQKLYKYDYLVALLMHSMSWAFMIMLPVAAYMSWDVNSSFVILFVLNTICHAFIDNAKANWLLINLITDQSIHIAQILVTFLTLVSYG